jgi:hypothetical protein
MTDVRDKIEIALDALMGACGFVGESGTERMFGVLFEAVQRVADEWDVVRDSHEDGLCYNVNALLSDAIAEALKSGGNPDVASVDTAVQ